MHREDRGLVEQGVVHTRHLYTIRKGELARDQIRDELARVESDIIKIKGRDGSWTCVFFDEDANTCGIYAQRPMECRELECWNPSRLEPIYRRDRLTRRDLLAGVHGLWELVEDHDRRCDYDRLRERPGRAGPSGDARIGREVAEAIRYDAELRQLMVARGGLEPGMLDFLLGRRVEQVLRLLARGSQEREC